MMESTVMVFETEIMMESSVVAVHIEIRIIEKKVKKNFIHLSV
jgi:hypothetical protein